MKKWMIRTAAWGTLALGIWAGTILLDRQTLDAGLIRLHVVGASDSRQDQSAKLRVRDAVLDSIRADLAEAGDMEAARACLQSLLPRVEAAANRTLKALGSEDRARVSLRKEAFPRRVYDTFTLPAGIYESLRVTVGEGAGHNWWCVAFPELCLPAAGRQVAAVAAEAGFSPSLRGAILGEQPYELRFYLLDLLGRLRVWAEDRE